MSTCPVCGHYWAWHDDSGCRVTTSATNCTCTERTPDMTDKTPPYVTTFDDIKTGQTIEREWTFMGVRFRAEGIAHRLSSGQWSSADGGVIADITDSTDVLRVLAEPPKPPLPTTPGSVIADATVGWDKKYNLLILMHDGRHDPYWTTTDGEVGPLFDGDVITDWTVVYDPTAPKADDGLRERVEELAGQYEQFPHLGTSHRSVALTLREALTDGADQ